MNYQKHLQDLMQYQFVLGDVGDLSLLIAA
jgi:hypothetical protein